MQYAQSQGVETDAREFEAVAGSGVQDMRPNWYKWYSAG